MTILPIKKSAIQMKGSFIIVCLLVELIALLNAFALQAQQGRGQIPVVKNNFTSFTRKYTNRGKLWMTKNFAYLRHPDANFADQYSPNSKAVELFANRTIDSKFYINKDTPSIVYSQRSSGPMHFKKIGQWITIDSRLQPKGPLVYEASNQEEPPGFDIKKKSSYIITADGKTYFNAWKLYGKNGDTETLLANADWTHYTAGDDGIAIKNIFPGIDAEMKVSRGSIKTSFIVHANKFAPYKNLLFRDSFLNGHDGNFSFSNGNPGNGVVSSADFRVSTSTIFHIKEGVMYQEKNPSSSHQFIPYYLDDNKLTLAINSNFLNDQFKTGDVTIDPMVQSMGNLKKNMITGSHSNQDCSLDTACEYDFMVPAPPGATLSDAMFSFEFTANAPCVGQDGAFSFVINGGCTSQMYTGTGTNTGPQQFQNQSILLSNGASLDSCFPSPVCGPGPPQNIPFSFFFYRSCHGPDGCDGSCIAASQDLVITLVGRTFDSASVTASPQNSCAGAPVTLTARGYYGIPPYNFSWPGLPQFDGDSVITVNPTVNTTYKVQVSDPCPGNGGKIMQSISVNVFPKTPTPVLTSNSPVCTGGQLVLSVPPVAGTTYFISNPGAGLGGGQYSSVAVFNNVTAAYGGTWIAVATDANGCTSDTSSTKVIISSTLSPTATITSSATNICAGTLVTFNATAINAGISPTYQWLLNSQKVGTNSPNYSGNSFANNDAVSCIVSASGPCAGASDISNTIVINVDATGTPTFDAIGPLCQNSIPPTLPLISEEGIAGTWSPANINTTVLGTVSYTFTPSAGSCAIPVSLNIAIVGTLTPTFNAIGPLCQNSTPPLLPLVSKEGIAGTWNPASINTSVLGMTTYTFTPSAGSCSTPASLNIAIVSNVSPTFPNIANSYCQNTSAPVLPPTSNEGITGTWSPASINTSVPGTATYTFTPSAGSCSSPVSLNITIADIISPTFPTIANTYCQNSGAPALPPTSNEGIAGTWSPASINTSVLGTTTYTFTPSTSSCSTPVSLNITIVSSLSPTFDAIGPLCQNSTAPALPPTSKEGVTGTWSPASINTSVMGTATYIFTPSSNGNCATPASLDVTIVNSITPSFPTIADSYCQNATAPALPPTSKEGVNGTWNPSSINTANAGSSLYTFTPSGGQCGESAQITIVINPPPVLTMGQDVSIANGASTTLNVTVTGNIVSYQWTPSTGLNNAGIKDPVASPSSTTTYTLDIIDENRCEASDSIRINVSGGGGGSSKILVPNAFSPNGDGINDTWVITNLSAYPGATVDVFNRYGQLVFHTENYGKAWDGTFNGKSLPAATYYYIIDPKNNEKKTAGSVTIFK